MSIRPATPDDVPELARIYADSRAEGMPFLPVLHTPEEDLVFFKGLVASEQQMWVVEGPDGLAGFCTVEDDFLNQLYVHPSFQGQGIGSRLLEKAREGLENMSLWVFQQNQRARNFYEHRQFHAVFETDGKNNEEKEPDSLYAWHRGLADQGIAIRRESPEDAPVIREIHDLAFGQAAEGRLVEQLREGGYFVPEMSLLAVSSERGPLGHVLFSDLSLESDSGSIRAAALAPVAVRPSHQRNGIGGALIRQGLTNLRLLGYETVIVLGDPAYYTQLGFTRSLAEKLDCEYQCEALMALELAPGSLTGPAKITVSYPPPFQDLE